MSQPTVLHIFSGDLWAGAEVMVTNLLVELKASRDVRVVALALNDGPSVQMLRCNHVETHVVPEAAASFTTIALRALRVVHAVQPDVIHSHRYKENLLAWGLGRVAGTSRLISTLHGLPEPRPGSANPGTAALRRRMDFQLLKRAFDSTVVVAHDLKNTLVREHGFRQDRVHVIHNGVTLPSGPYPPPHRNDGHAIHVGTVARLAPVKGLDLFVETAGLVARHVPGAQFSILGEGPLRERLLALASAHGVQHRLRILPPTLDPTAYYRSLDLYMNTSLHEGLPLSVVEAMGHRRPVVAAKVGGIPEIITHARDGFLVDGRHPDAFARWILTLARDQALREHIAEQGLLRVRSCFTASQMAQRYGILYREGLRQATRTPPGLRQEGGSRCA